MTELGKAGFLYRGNYSASDTYNRMDVVTYLPNVYICLKNVVRNITPNDDGTNWKLFIKGASIQTTAEMLAALDNAQATADSAIAKIGQMNDLNTSDKSNVVVAVNEVLTKLDNAQATADSAIAKIGNVPTGKTLQSQIDGLEPRVSSSEQALTVNLLNPTSASKTVNGITATRNADNTYTLNGTATLKVSLVVKNFTATKSQNVRITGCPQGGTESSFYIAVNKASDYSGIVRDFGNGTTKELSAGENYNFLIMIQPGTVCDNLTFKPMLTTNLSATYDDYIPYSGSSGKLDTDYKALSDKIGNVGNTDLQSQLNAATQSIAQNTTDIAKVTLSYIQSTRVPMENLGTAVTAEQLSYIKNGEGYQLGLGSYWDDQAQGIVWRIWDFDKFYNTGDTALKTRNALVMPDANLIHADGSTHYMNSSDTTEGGYNATKYRSTYRPQCRTKFANFFGSAHIVTHRELLSNAVSNGAASGWSWYDCDVELPTEEMIYGHGVFGTSTIGGQGGHNVGNSWGRLALSLLKPEFVCNRENYWLRNVVSALYFASVAANGRANYHGASDPNVGFRPFALIS